MSSFGAIIDLSKDAAGAQQMNKKRKPESSQLRHVWIAYHQLENGEGYFENDYSDSAHMPTMFDKTILGIFITQKAARRRAYEACLDEGLICEKLEDEEQDEDERLAGLDFEGEGVFKDCDENNRNFFSERIHIKREKIEQE
jgi:hypothetical protein